jgi:hypothetical protein
MTSGLGALLIGSNVVWSAAGRACDSPAMDRTHIRNEVCAIMMYLVDIEVDYLH